MPNSFVLSRKGGGIVMFDVDEEYSRPNHMISGKAGKGRLYYVKLRVVMFYAVRHPLITIKGLFNSIKA